MHHLRGVFCVLLGTMACAGMEMVKNGKPCSEIVVSDAADAEILSAARDLQLHIGKISGARIPIVSAANARSGNLICVGESSYTRKTGYKLPPFKGSGYDILVRENRIILAGPEKRQKSRPSGYEKDMHPQSRLFSLASAASAPEDDCGAMHAVSAFLEFLGVRFYAPYEEGTVISRKTDTLSVPDFRITREAAFARRVYQYGPAQRKDSAGAMWFKRLKCGSALTPPGILPLSAVLKHSASPDWAAKDRAGRPLKTNDGCIFPRFTHPGFQRECVKYIRKILDANPGMKQLQLVLPVLRGENDARDLESWRTREIYPEPVNSNIMTAFFAAVAGEVKKTHPDRVLLCQSVRGNVLPVPEYRKSLPGNLEIQPFSRSAILYAGEAARSKYFRQISGLAAMNGKEKMHQLEWWNEFASLQTPRQGGWFMHALQRTRRGQRPFISGVLMQAAPDAAAARLAEVPLTHLMYYVNSKLLWDPDLDLDALLDEYYSLWFGPSAAVMKSFFQYAEHLCSQSGRRSVSLTGGQMTPENAAVCLELLDKAAANTRPDTVYRRRIDALRHALAPLKDIFRKRIPQGPRLRGAIFPAETRCGGDLSKYRVWTVIPGDKKDVRTEFALGVTEDRRNLLVALRCYEPEMSKLKSPLLHPDDPALFQGDHVRIEFITPESGSYLMAVNPRGSFADGSPDPGSVAGNGCCLGWNPPASNAAVKHFSDRWEAEVMIGLGGCGTPPDFGDAWGINVARIRKNNGKEQHFSLLPGAEGKPELWHRFVLPATDSRNRKITRGYQLLVPLKEGKKESVYTIRRAAGPVRLSDPWDGKDWKRIPEIRLGWELFSARSSGFRPDARAKIQYDGKYLYLLYQVRDQYVRGTFKNDQDMVCLDSCMEFFVQPDKNGPYYNFECSCIGTLLLYEVVKNNGQLKMTPLSPEELKQVKRFSTLPRDLRGEIAEPVVWRLGLQIPLSLLVRRAGVKLPLSGQVWRGNVYKCADWTSHPCWLMWKENDTFHHPEGFGALIFE